MEFLCTYSKPCTLKGRLKKMTVTIDIYDIWLEENFMIELGRGLFGRRQCLFDHDIKITDIILVLYKYKSINI